MTSAIERWCQQLAAWAIPDEILAQAPEPPWGFLPGMFQAPDEAPDSAARRAALSLLGTGGTVLDIGCGGGAASLALVPPATAVVGVDERAEALAQLTTSAAAVGVAVRTLQGRWPDVAPQVPPAEVVVCHHVAYNVADLDVFALALTDHARRGVVLELGARHPLTWLAPLWRRFWGLDRPSGPTADDLVAVLHEVGLAPQVERDRRVGPHRLAPDQRVHLVRKRLCLPADRDPEIAAALAEVDAHEDEADRDVVAVSWPSHRGAT